MSGAPALSVCETPQVWFRAVELLAAMADARVGQCTITYSAALGACNKDGRWFRAVKLLAVMAVGCMEWDTICNAASSACEKASQWLRDMELLGEMAFDRVEQDTISYSAAISACARAANGLELQIS